MTDFKQTISAELKKAAPTVDDANIASLVTKLIEEIGVSSLDDLREVREQDLSPFLKPIPARKILAVWSNSGKCYLGK
jgi:hypothetical protein